MNDTEKIKAVLQQYQDGYSAKARLTRYKQYAENQIETLKELSTLPERLQGKWEALLSIIAYAKDALQAVEKNDIDLFAQLFERILREHIRAQLPDLESKQKRVIASKPRSKEKARAKELFDALSYQGKFPKAKDLIAQLDKESINNIPVERAEKWITEFRKK